VGSRPRLGQHFLSSPGILDRIARAIAAAAGSACPVIEIGAGPGPLTARLLELGLRVTAIEVDPRLAARLRAAHGSDPRLEVLQADILSTGLAQLIAGRPPGRAVVAGNLPYYITSPILQRICDAAERIPEAVLLVQKEVAARIAARPGSRDFGYLSVLCQSHARAEVLFDVPAGAFRPAPKVVSALVRLRMEPRLAAWGVAGREQFLEFAQLCFRRKRQTLGNNLKERFGREKLAGVGECRLRGEQLGVEGLAGLWLRLSAPGANG